MRQLRPSTVQVDLAVLRQNFGKLARRAGPEAEVLAAVKADAYGHGAVEVARTLAEAGCRWFGVALVEEGVELRRAGVDGEILVFGGVEGEGLAAALAHRLVPVVHDLGQASVLQAELQVLGRELEVHLEIDTGMGRLGLHATDLSAGSGPGGPGSAEILARLERLRVVGAMTHLAAAEDDPEFTLLQRQRFTEALAALEAVGIRPEILHADNSAGLAHGPTAGARLVRPGIALYGADPGGGVARALGVEPCLRVVTGVKVIRHLHAGDSVSYGRTWTAERPSRIAVLPVGYGDGYPRRLSGRAEVLLRGRRCPVRGRVCMDLTMVDVTHLPEDVSPGEEVVLLGSQGAEDVTVEELAAWADTIPYEIFCSLSARLPRRYQGGE